MRVPSVLLASLTAATAFRFVNFPSVNKISRCVLEASALGHSLKSPAGKITVVPELSSQVVKKDKDDDNTLDNPFETDLWKLAMSMSEEESNDADDDVDVEEIHELSKSMRESSKASCIVVRSEMKVLTEVVREQEKARGNFPGPCPVVFCPAEDAEEDLASLTKSVAAAGAAGIVLDVDAESLGDITKVAEAAGLELLPRLHLADLSEAEREALVGKVNEALPGSAVVLSGLSPETPLPAAASSMTVLGDVEVPAGAGLLIPLVQQLHEVGYHSVLLRSGCLPEKLPFSKQHTYWAAAVGALRSTQSSTFRFRIENSLATSEAAEWAKYLSVAQELLNDDSAGGNWDNMPDNPNVKGGGMIQSDKGDWLGF